MSTLERRKRDKEIRRKQILRAAKHEFFRHGFNNASMEKIAQRCQLAKGTLYLYFKNKEDLYVSLIEDGIELLHKKMLRAIIPDHTIDEKLCAMAEAFYEFSIKHKDYFAILILINADDIIRKVDKEKLMHIREIETEAIKPGVLLIKEGIREGMFPQGMNAVKSIIMFWASITGAVTVLRNEKESKMFDTIDTDTLVRDVAQTIINGFKYRTS